MDADGNVVPLTTRKLYDGKGREVEVGEIALVDSILCGRLVWRVRTHSGVSLVLDLLHLARPDTWESLVADLELLDTEPTLVSATCAYWNATQKPCRHYDAEQCSHYSPNHLRCYFGIIRDILRRIRALRKAERDEG